MSQLSALEANKSLYERFEADVLNRRDLSAANLRRYVSDDFRDHSDEKGLRGHQAIVGRLRPWAEAFPDSREETTKIIAERDMVAVMFTTTGHHVGAYLGISGTNRSIVLKGIRIVRVEAGRIAELWEIQDYLSLAMQLGREIRFRSPRHSSVADAPRRPRPSREEIAYEAQVARIQSSDGELRRNAVTLLGFQRDVFNAQDWRVENLARYLKPDIEDHNAFAGDPPGLEGVRHRFSAWQAAFDNAEEENMAMVGEGDTLAVLYHLHATHNGPFMGIAPTRRDVVIPGIEVLRFADGMIAEHWGIYDFMATADEIGSELFFHAAELGSVA